MGEALKVEATVRALKESEGLTLEFWMEKPSGKFEAITSIKPNKLSPGEEATYTAEITSREEGLYKIFAYLYDGVEILGQKKEDIAVKLT